LAVACAFAGESVCRAVRTDRWFSRGVDRHGRAWRQRSAPRAPYGIASATGDATRV